MMSLSEIFTVCDYIEAKPGKAATKGQKQIHEENVETLSFYRKMALGSSGFWLLVNFLLVAEFTLLRFCMTVLSIGTLLGSVTFMKTMARARFDERGSVLDAGVDLNMLSGVAEHIKDIIILTSGLLILGCLSDYFWLAFLLIPCRGFWMLWVNVLGPWFFAPAPEDSGDADAMSKKQKKLERKMRRQQ